MNSKETATRDLLMHHLTAFGDTNLDEIMLDYSEESTILNDKGALNGLDMIRQFFSEMFQLIPGGSQFEMKQLTICGSVAQIIWNSKSNAADIPFGTDTFFMEENKIKVHTVSAFIK